MDDKNLPRLNLHYWLAILAVSILGTTGGDYVADGLDLGFAGGLLAFGVVVAAIFLAERYSPWKSVLWYWAAIAATRMAATNLGDFLSRTLGLGTGLAAGLLAVVLIVFLLAWRSPARRRASDQRRAPDALPKANARYWLAVLIASTLGTTGGDFISGDMGLGLGRSSLCLYAVFAAVVLLERRATAGQKAFYWTALVAARTAGTVLGDFLTSREGLGMGYAAGACVAGAVLVCVLLAPRAAVAVRHFARGGLRPHRSQAARD